MAKHKTIFPVRQFADRGLQWLLTSPEHVREVILQVAPEMAKAIDFARMATMGTSFIPDNLRQRECDVLVRVPFKRGRKGEIWIYILIELQSAPCPIMPYRVIGYILQVWEAQKRALEEKGVPEGEWRFHFVLPVLLYTGQRAWDAPLDMAELVDVPTGGLRFVPRHDTLFLDLKRRDPEKLTQSGDPFGWLLRVIQKEDTTGEGIADAIRQAVEHIDLLPQEEKARWEKLMYYLVLLICHRAASQERPDLMGIVREGTRDRRRRKEVRRMGKTYAEELIEQGIEQGEARGVVKAKRDDVLRQMRAKFGTVSASAARRIRSIRSVDRLNLLLERVLFADSVDEIVQQQ